MHEYEHFGDVRSKIIEEEFLGVQLSLTAIVQAKRWEHILIQEGHETIADKRLAAFEERGKKFLSQMRENGPVIAAGALFLAYSACVTYVKTHDVRGEI